MRTKIVLDTMSDIQKFVAVTTAIPYNIVVKDNNNHCVNAKSLLGMIYAMEFDEIWCECDVDIFHQIREFVR